MHCIMRDSMFFITRDTQPVGVMCIHLAKLLVLGRLLQFVARKKAGNVTNVHRSTRCVITLVVLGDMVRRTSHIPHPPSPFPHPTSPHSPSPPPPPGRHRRQFRRRRPLPLHPPPNCSSSRRLRRRSASCLAANHAPNVSVSILSSSSSGNSDLGAKIAGDVWAIRYTAFNAASIQPACEAAVTVFIVATFAAAGGCYIFFARISPAFGEHACGFRFIPPPHPSQAPTPPPPLQSTASTSCASSAACCSG